MERASVLLVGNTELISKHVELELERHFRLQRCEQLDKATLEDCDVLLLPHELAVQVPASARGAQGPRVIALAARPVIADLVSAMRIGVHDMVLDAADVSALRKAISDAARQRRLLLNLASFERQIPVPRSFPSLLGTSAAMNVLRERITRIAGSLATTLISGPSGSGKELVARALHDASGRSAPLVTVAASAGQLPQVPNGTLLVDEVAELPAPGQALLMRRLDERNTRIVATTSSELEREVSTGRFREDLYRRLAAAYLRVPPLKERDHDVLLLAQHTILRQAAGRVSGLTPAAAHALLGYSWPGNVRELERCILTALDAAHADHIGEADLPRHVRRLPAPAASERALEPLDAVEREHIVKTLRAVDGNKALAARILELDRKTLFRKLQAYEKSEHTPEPRKSEIPPARPRSDSIPG